MYTHTGIIAMSMYLTTVLLEDRQSRMPGKSLAFPFAPWEGINRMTQPKGHLKHVETSVAGTEIIQSQCACFTAGVP